MAENTEHEHVHVVPTAVHIGEQPFPYGKENEHPSFTTGHSLKPSATDGGATTDISQDLATPQHKASEPTKSSRPLAPRLETDPTSNSRPQVRTSLTEREPPRTKNVQYGRSRRSAGFSPEKLSRQLTYQFDPYSSCDSTSSSDEDEATTPSKDDPEPTKPKRQKTRRDSSSDHFNRFKISNAYFRTKGKVSKTDGRLKISINETVNSGYIAKALGAGLRRHFKPGKDHDAEDFSPDADRASETAEIESEEDAIERDPKRRIRLNICVIVIGSRGDIQPFLKIGKILKDDYGHRVRIATHPAFKEFVEKDSGLEFFSVGGDPSELMAFMVKNPGLIPSVETVRAGEIGRRRASMYDMFHGMWRACVNSTDDETDKENVKMMGDKNPFIADAIIANPPSFAPPHIAERLGVPLHMMFTFPYTPTTQFPHPLANIKTSNADREYTNFMSYPLVEMMTWQGLGDLINRFRAKTLGLEQVSTLWAPGQLYRLKVPHTYMWSPSLVPKPHDWGPEIDLTGFVFLELASSFEPPDSLTKFLDAGPPPVYIGFGSIVVDDPDKFTKLIFDAVEKAGVRALVSKGWGGLGDEDNTPDKVYMLENTPHDWLFPRVSAVVHHGGAGTTAIGLKCGKPTMIVPFFGDQPFWGSMVSRAKAGAHECIPYKKLTAERLAEGIKQCLTEDAKANVQKIADSIAREGDGAANAVKSFHRSLPLRGKINMRCELLTNHVAVWRHKKTGLRLSSLAAELLVEWKKVKWNELRLLRHYEWNDFGGPGEPITGGWGAIIGSVSGAAKGVGLVPLNMARSVKHREQHWEKKKKIEKRKKHIAARTTNQQKENVADGQNGNASRPPNGRPAGPERGDTTLSKLSSLSADPDENLAEELAEDAGHGFSKSGKAIVKAPMEFSLAIAQGFHNAPRLYGDETVRRPARISGFHSGLRAGRDEFLYGMYDGVTGLYLQPYHGAREAGALGFLQGIPLGIGGLVLKSISATIGPTAYAMKGLYEEMHKKNQPIRFLRRARIIQGQKEIALLGKGQLSDPVERNGDEGDVKEERERVERAVSLGWEEQQKRAIAEQRERKSGMRGKLGLKGRTNKTAPAISRHASPKSSMEDTPKKTSSTPIQTTEKDEEPKRGRDRGITAPETAMAWKEKNKSGLDAPVKLQEEARKAGAGMNGAPTHLPKRSRFDSADGNEKEGRPSAEMRGRAASDIVDWATIKRGEQRSNEVASMT